MKYSRQDLQIARAMLLQWWRSKTTFDKAFCIQIYVMCICIPLLFIDAVYPFAPHLKAITFAMPMVFMVFNMLLGSWLDKRKPEEPIKTPFGKRNKRTKPKLYVVPKEPDQSA